MLSKNYMEYLTNSLGLELTTWQTICHYDLPLREKFVQRIKNCAYWTFREGKRPVLASIFSLIPYLNRARNWEYPPYFVCADDHVIAVAEKPEKAIKALSSGENGL